MRHRFTQIGPSVLAALVAAVLLAPPASAKGAPSQAVITGPGLASPIMLGNPGSRTIGGDLRALVEKSGFAMGAWGVYPHRRVQRPAGNLGPRYTIIYVMTPGSGSSDQIKQYVFPYAEPQPLTYMPPHQQFWSGNEETTGGWYAAHADLKQTLIGAGLPATAPAGPAEDLRAATQNWFLRILWIAGAAAIVLAGVFIRRRARQGIEGSTSPVIEPH